MNGIAEQGRHLQVSCVECHYTEVVDSDSGRAADLIIEHGREKGHKLVTEAVEPVRDASRANR